MRLYQLLLGGFLFLIISCNYTTPELLAPPRIVGNLDSTTPLVPYLEVKASEPVRVVLEIYDGADHRWIYQPGGLFKKNFNIPVFQLQANTNYEFKLSIVDTWLNRTDYDSVFHFQTPVLPEQFPTMQLVTALEEYREPGFKIMSIARKTNQGLDENYGLLVALNYRGEVVWYFHHTKLLGALQLCRSENILAIDGKGYVLELNLKGELIREFIASDISPAKDNPSSAIVLETPNIHGAVEPNSRRYYLALGKSKVSAVDSNFLYTNDRLIEFDRSGKFLKDIALQPLLAPLKIRTANVTSENLPFSFQSLSHDAKTGALLIAAPQPPLIARVERSTDQFSWIFSNPEITDFTSTNLLLEADSIVHWPNYIQAMDFTPQRTYIVWDQYQPENSIRQNRILEYRIDDKAKTIRQLWEYNGGEEGQFSCLPNSTVQKLPNTGNVLFFAKNKAGQGFLRELSPAREDSTIFELIVDTSFVINGLLHVPNIQMKIEGE